MSKPRTHRRKHVSRMVLAATLGFVGCGSGGSDEATSSASTTSTSEELAAVPEPESTTNTKPAAELPSSVTEAPATPASIDCETESSYREVVSACVLEPLRTALERVVASGLTFESFVPEDAVDGGSLFELHATTDSDVEVTSYLDAGQGDRPDFNDIKELYVSIDDPAAGPEASASYVNVFHGEHGSLETEGNFNGTLYSTETDDPLEAARLAAENAASIVVVLNSI